MTRQDKSNGPVIIERLARMLVAAILGAVGYLLWNS